PVAFMQGSIGRFFYQFGITVTVAVLLSLVVSLTITPMLCAFFLNVRQPKRKMPPAWGGLLGWAATGWSRASWVFDRFVVELLLLRPVNWVMHQLTRAYAVVLRWALRLPWLLVPSAVVLALAALVFVCGVNIPIPEWGQGNIGKTALTLKPIGQELVPSEDQNRFAVNVICLVGSSIDYVDEALQRGEDILIGLTDPESGKEVVASCFAAVSIRPGSLISEGILFVRLIPANERGWSQGDVMNEVRKGYAKIPGVRVVVLDLSTQGFTPTRGYPIDFAVQGPDWDTVTKLSENIRQKMIDSGVVTDVNSDYRPGMPEYHVLPDRDKAAEVGLPLRQLAFTLNVAFGGMRDGRFTDLDKRYDVRLRYLETQRESPDQLDDLYL